MLFFEFGFLFVFLPLVLIVDRSLADTRARNRALLGFSLLFYAASSLPFVPILMLSIGVDFFCSRRMAVTEPGPARRRWLLVAVLSNLTVLGLFKYTGFVTRSLHVVMPAVPVVELPLPVGISFFTFQSMSYSIDVYRGAIQPTRRLEAFAAYVAMFPQLIAGPIVRWSSIAGAMDERPRTNEAGYALGLRRLILGLGRKLLVADTLGHAADALFARTDVGFVDGWVAMILYSGQIYYDFSGYSEMAIGLGFMLGFRFPENFDAPYCARSFSDFWRRWHITLSQWLRDYLYISLGGNRGSTFRTYVNLTVTMLLGGLWHGASWSFVLWGGLHGAYLVGERLLGRLGLPVPTPVRIGLVYALVVWAWVPFRLPTLDATLRWWSAMLGLHGWGAIEAFPAALSLAFLALVWTPRPGRADAPIRVAEGLALVALFVTALFVGYGRVETSPFLYFRF